MSRVLVRKQMFDPKQAANNMAAVTDLSSGGAVEQLGLLNLLSGPQKPLAPAAAEKLGYDRDSKQYRRLRMGERIGQGLAGAYGGFRALDALGSGRSPTSAIGAGAGAYGSVAPIASRVGVRAASRGMKPAEPAPEKTRQTTLDEFSNVKPPVAVVQPQPFVAASPVAVTQPSPLEIQAHNLPPGQKVFATDYAGPAKPPREVKVAQPTVAMNPQEKNMLAYGAQIKPAEGSKTTTTQPQQDDEFTPKDKRILSETQKIIEEYEDPDAEEKAREQGQLQGA
jgi:hypothetical protein